MLSFNVDHLKYYLRNMPMVQVLRFCFEGGGGEELLMVLSKRCSKKWCHLFIYEVLERSNKNTKNRKIEEEKRNETVSQVKSKTKNKQINKLIKFTRQMKRKARNEEEAPWTSEQKR